MQIQQALASNRYKSKNNHKVDNLNSAVIEKWRPDGYRASVDQATGLDESVFGASDIGTSRAGKSDIK